MGKAEEIRAEQEKAARARPIILAGLRKGRDSRLIAEGIATQFELDPRTAYNWVVFSEEKFDKSRRFIAGLGIAVLSIGFAAIAAAAVLRVLEVEAFRRPLLFGFAIGLPVASVGLILGLVSRRLATAD